MKPTSTPQKYMERAEDVKKVKKARTACKARTCTGCLWHWPSLTPGEAGVYRCYQTGSEHYHKETTKRCVMYEERPKVGK